MSQWGEWQEEAIVDFLYRWKIDEPKGPWRFMTAAHANALEAVAAAARLVAQPQFLCVGDVEDVTTGELIVDYAEFRRLATALQVLDSLRGQ